MRWLERRAALFVAPLCLVAALGGGWLAVRRPGWLFVPVATLLIGSAALWILVSALSPAKADRRCPRCGANSLVRLDDRSTRGVRCTRCPHRDEGVSSFYLAEEEGPLEDIVLAERAARRGRRQRGES
jgi:DNA-directed RNA polymerase subunit RPC12/RpoP